MSARAAAIFALVAAAAVIGVVVATRRGPAPRASSEDAAAPVTAVARPPAVTPRPLPPTRPQMPTPTQPPTPTQTQTPEAPSGPPQQTRAKWAERLNQEAAEQRARIAQIEERIYALEVQRPAPGSPQASELADLRESLAGARDDLDDTLQDLRHLQGGGTDEER